MNKEKRMSVGGGEPRVIADDPMGEDQNSTSPTGENKRNALKINTQISD